MSSRLGRNPFGQKSSIQRQDQRQEKVVEMEKKCLITRTLEFLLVDLPARSFLAALKTALIAASFVPTRTKR